MSRRDIGTDDDRVRVRPPKRGTRPRTKVRPRHKDAVPARVLVVDRGRYTLVTEDDTRVVAMKARELGRGAKNAVVVGDVVDVVGDVSGQPDSLARIVRVRERTTALRRSGEDGESLGVERVIVANADQLLIVTALADPPPRPAMVDRCLVAAYDAGMQPVLVLTKADLADPGPFLAQYAALNVPAIITAVDDDGVHGLTELRELVTGHDSVMVGHSGVGKSTLINALVPGARRAIGVVNVVTGRGRHTSSSAVALELPEGGWVIDTPGVRSFGLSHVEPDDLLPAFGDLSAAAEDCPRDCSHSADAPDCALDAWAAAGTDAEARQDRLDSFRRLLASRIASAADHS
ncbi:ribosome small subunit-dependent GTPase A [Georgenia sunbinii]|uniref:ribosome small subunit-dependent GTPase A n=1 Tax=Georgenia sunbinii TaxID=3117728 RepID=UPI002F26684A